MFTVFFGQKTWHYFQTKLCHSTRNLLILLCLLTSHKKILSLKILSKNFKFIIIPKHTGKECRFGYGKFFSKRTIIAKPLSEQLQAFEGAEILGKQKLILNKVKNFIDSDLNPKKRNFLNPAKDNYDPITMIIDDRL